MDDWTKAIPPADAEELARFLHPWLATPLADTGGDQAGELLSCLLAPEEPVRGISGRSFRRLGLDEAPPDCVHSAAVRLHQSWPEGLPPPVSGLAAWSEEVEGHLARRLASPRRNAVDQACVWLLWRMGERTARTEPGAAAVPPSLIGARLHASLDGAHLRMHLEGGGGEHDYVVKWDARLAAEIRDGMRRRSTTGPAPTTGQRNLGHLTGALVHASRLEPVLQQLPVDGWLHLCLDEALHDLPWEAILTSGPERPPWAQRLAIWRDLPGAPARPARTGWLHQTGVIIAPRYPAPLHLAAAAREAEQLRQLLTEAGCAPRLMEQFAPEDLDQLLPECAWLHFAGHGPATDEAASLWRLPGDPVVTGNDIVTAGSELQFVFSNACPAEGGSPGAGQLLRRLGTPLALVSAAPLPEAAASAFALAVYQGLLKGKSLGPAVMEARRELAVATGDEQWAACAYQLWGDPTAAGAQSGPEPHERQ